MIKKLHFIWYGAPMPERYHDFQRTWIDLHPDFTVERWNVERMLSEFPELAEPFDRCGDERQKADLGRLFILYQYGGLYVDCDFECFKSLSPLMGESFIGSEDGASISTGLIYARRPRNRFIGGLKEQSLSFDPTKEATNETGPIMVTKFWREHPFGIRVHAPEYFYPVHWSESYADLERANKMGAYACHHWRVMTH